MSKESLRIKGKSIRIELSNPRRARAKEELVETLLPILKPYDYILSFASLPEEIDIWPLNEILAKERRLSLPRLVNGKLIPYTVNDISKLEPSSYKILEPSHLSPPISISNIQCILVPGLGFTQKGHRLGFGGGYYDRFLAGIKAIPFFGIGFTEQLIDYMPVEEHDIPMTKLFLF